MAINHRCVLRVSTDLALAIFFLFFVGAVLWVTDEFLGWDVLPGWIENYAQLIIIVVGAAAGLAIASSVLCSIVVIAESVAERVGIHDYRQHDATLKMEKIDITLRSNSISGSQHRWKRPLSANFSPDKLNRWNHVWKVS